MQASNCRRPARIPARTQGLSTVVVVVIVALIAILAWRLLSHRNVDAELQDEVEARSAVPVSTIHPTAVSGSQVLALPGNTEALNEAPIYARTSGYLRRWRVDIGASVKAGDVLAEIDAPELDQELNQAEAALATAEANAAIAKTSAERWRGLRDTDSVSAQEADERISSAEAAMASVKAAKANVDRLRQLSGFKQVVAPFDGIVTARNTDIGQLITAGSTSGHPLFRVADISRLRIYVRVPQTYAASMRPGIEARVQFPDRPGKEYAAKLVRTSNAIDQASRTLLAELEVDNSSGDLLPGAYAELRFDLPESAVAAVRIPSNTLLFRADGMRVALVNADGTLALRPVTIGRDFGTEVEIIDGLRPEDEVIVSPSDSITERSRVRVVQPKDEGAAAPEAS